MLFEDAHWADPTTLEVLDLLIGPPSLCWQIRLQGCRGNWNGSFPSWSDRQRFLPPPRPGYRPKFRSACSEAFANWAEVAGIAMVA
jgi:hypothetical protein